MAKGEQSHGRAVASLHNTQLPATVRPSGHPCSAPSGGYGNAWWNRCRGDDSYLNRASRARRLRPLDSPMIRLLSFRPSQCFLDRRTVRWKPWFERRPGWCWGRASPPGTPHDFTGDRLIISRERWQSGHVAPSQAFNLATGHRPNSQAPVPTIWRRRAALFALAIALVAYLFAAQAVMAAEPDGDPSTPKLPPKVSTYEVVAGETLLG